MVLSLLVEIERLFWHRTQWSLIDISNSSKLVLSPTIGIHILLCISFCNRYFLDMIGGKPNEQGFFLKLHHL